MNETGKSHVSFASNPSSAAASRRTANRRTGQCPAGPRASYCRMGLEDQMQLNPTNLMAANRRTAACGTEQCLADLCVPPEQTLFNRQIKI
eukprot:1143472-Pelagomonas_calceolata.AAC.1